MPQQPDPVDPGPDEDLAWLDRDPMTAGENGFAGVSEAELVGLVCAWDRVEAHAAARKLAAIAELDRRNRILTDSYP